MPKCIICEKDFPAKRADAKICSPKCRQKATRNGVKLRGAAANYGIIVPPKEEFNNSIEVVVENLMVPEQEIAAVAHMKTDGLVTTTTDPKVVKEFKEKSKEGVKTVLKKCVAEPASFFMGHEVPKGLKGIDLSIWKAEIKEKNK